MVASESTHPTMNHVRQTAGRAVALAESMRPSGLGVVRGRAERLRLRALSWSSDTRDTRVRQYGESEYWELERERFSQLTERYVVAAIRGAIASVHALTFYDAVTSPKCSRCGEGRRVVAVDSDGAPHPEWKCASCGHVWCVLTRCSREHALKVSEDPASVSGIGFEP